MGYHKYTKIFEEASISKIEPSKTRVSIDAATKRHTHFANHARKGYMHYYKRPKYFDKQFKLLNNHTSIIYSK